MPKKIISCSSCEAEIDITDAETMMVSCPRCGVNIGIQKRWRPRGTEDVLAGLD